jgi:hypothetical protein
VHALEFTPAKKLVWALRSWTADANLGPAATLQLLGSPAVPENVHFGDIK